MNSTGWKVLILSTMGMLACVFFEAGGCYLMTLDVEHKAPCSEARP